MIGPAELATLRHAGLIPGDRYLEAVHRVRDRAYWTRWAMRTLLAVGVVHLLAGVVFFFAYNWADMSAMTKFAVVEAGILLAVAGAWIAGLDRPAGQSLLVGATVLTGVLLAVIGQVYQTGADAYELFLAWTGLALPWVLASRSAAHWLVWLAVACLAAGLFADQALAPMGWIEAGEAPLLPGVVLVAAAAVREVATSLGARWLSAQWTRQVIVFAALGCLFAVAVGFVFHWNERALGVLAFGLAVAAGAVVYGRLRPDFAAVAQIIGFAGLFLMAVGARMVDEWIGFAWSDLAQLLFALGLLIVWLVAITGTVGFALRVLRPWLRGGP